MPGNVSDGDDSRVKSPTTYRFNVEYDESIFIPGSVRFEKNGCEAIGRSQPRR